MDTGSDDSGDPSGPLRYRLCPRCARAVPHRSGERYCPNDGARLMDACPQCWSPITSPYARFCVRCGTDLMSLAYRTQASPSQS